MLFVEGNHFCPPAKERQLQAAGAGLRIRHGGTRTSTQFYPRPPGGRQPPGRAARLQPLHPLRAVRAPSREVDGKTCSPSPARHRQAPGRQCRIPAGWRHRPRRHRRRDAGLPGGRDPAQAGQGFAVPIGQRTDVRRSLQRRRPEPPSEGRHEQPFAPQSCASPPPRWPAASAATCPSSTSTSTSSSWSSSSSSTARRSPTSSGVGPATSASSKAAVQRRERPRAARVPRNCKTLVALGACAVNGGLPAQRNHLPLADCLRESVPDGSRQRPSPTTPSCRCPRQGAPDPRGGAGRLSFSRLPALGRRHLAVPHRPDGRAHAAARPACCLRSTTTDAAVPTPANRETAAAPVAIDPVSASRGTAGHAAASTREPAVHEARLHIVEFRGFENSSRAALLGGAGDGAAPVRHLPGEPPPGRRQGARTRWSAPCRITPPPRRSGG